MLVIGAPKAPEERPHKVWIALLMLDRRSCLAAIVFGDSVAFAMPIGYQTSMMSVGPGGYRVRDFARIGIALELILAAVAVDLIPH